MAVAVSQNVTALRNRLILWLSDEPTDVSAPARSFRALYERSIRVLEVFQIRSLHMVVAVSKASQNVQNKQIG